MAVGPDADTDYITRGSIPSGGAGTLTGGADGDAHLTMSNLRDFSLRA